LHLISQSYFQEINEILESCKFMPILIDYLVIIVIKLRLQSFVIELRLQERLHKNDVIDYKLLIAIITE